MKSPFHATSATVHGPNGAIAAAAIVPLFLSLEDERRKALAGGQPATAEWLRLKALSLTEATVEAKEQCRPTTYQVRAGLNGYRVVRDGPSVFRVVDEYPSLDEARAVCKALNGVVEMKAAGGVR